MESLGIKIRQQRRRLGLTLEEVAGRTSISKPYLSLIETGRVSNPASDDKLRRIEQALGFSAGELITQAHLYRTPKDVRAVLHQLMNSDETGGKRGNAAKTGSGKSSHASDPENLSGMFREIVDGSAAKFGPLVGNAVPLINQNAGSSGDLEQVRRAADTFVSCPEVNDPQAFAARVQGDSMMPKYNNDDIVIFSPAQTPRDGNDCFVRFADGQTAFKRIFFESGDDNRPMIRLQPRNERYRAQIVSSEQVVGMFRAVYRYHQIDDE